MKKLAFVFILTGMFFGIIIGAGSVIGYHLHSNRNTTVWVTTDDLTGDNNLRIPAGTELVYDKSMSEGFDRTKLYINLEPETSRKKIIEKTYPRAFFIPPVWAE